MNADEMPPGMRAMTLKSGAIAYYWRPRPKDVAKGYIPKSRALGRNFATACKVAKGLNADLINWRNGVERPRYTEGTFTWLIHQFEQSRAYKSLSASAQRDYSRNLAQIADLKIKGANKLASVSLDRINARVADRIYEKLLERGSRTAAYAIATIRKAWNTVRRLWPEKMPANNPFEAMGISHKPKETVPATWEELASFVAKAVEKDEIGMAIAAQAAWDLCMRPDEIFKKFARTHWRPETHPNQCWVGSAKNDHGAWIYVADPETGEPFYPELDTLIESFPPQGPLMVMRRRRRGAKVYDDWIPINNSPKQARDIRTAAKLPDHVTIAAFRHGGLTELGEGGLSDTLAQALSRHKQRSTLTHYLHQTDPLLLEAARKRAAHRKQK